MSKSWISIHGTSVPPGTKAVVRVPVFTDLDGQQLSIYIHAVAGAKPGPTFALISAMHGKHWFSSETTRRFIEGLDPAEMSGNVIAVAVGNPLALVHRTRHVRDESDNQDVNAVFGISKRFMSNQIAASLAEHVLQKADAYGIVYGGPLWAVKSMTVERSSGDKALLDRSYRLARAFGVPHIRVENTLPGHSMSYATTKLGIPCFLAELGGTGFEADQEETWFQENLDGLHNVLRHLHILAGEEIIPERVLIYPTHARTNPPNGGMLEPLLPVENLMSGELQPGHLVCRVWSPYTFEVVEEIHAPVRGFSNLIPVARPVRPGDWAAMMIDLDDPFTRWLEPHEVP